MSLREIAYLISGGLGVFIIGFSFKTYFNFNIEKVVRDFYYLIHDSFLNVGIRKDVNEMTLSDIKNMVSSTVRQLSSFEKDVESTTHSLRRFLQSDDYQKMKKEILEFTVTFRELIKDIKEIGLTISEEFTEIQETVNEKMEEDNCNALSRFRGP